MKIGGLFRPSGGLSFHWRGLRKKKLWRAFSISLEHWLTQWKLSEIELILISPSAGYTLPHSWLAQFKRVYAYDIDPLAAWLFRRRHPGLNLNFVCEDLFWLNGNLSLARLRQCLTEHPQAAVLFCNVLGQLPLENQVEESRWNSYLEEIRTLLEHRRWASYHDQYTIEPLPRSAHLEVGERLRNGFHLQEALKPVTNLRSCVVIDHLMQGTWCRGLEQTLMTWSLSENSLHVIQGVRT